MTWSWLWTRRPTLVGQALPTDSLPGSWARPHPSLTPTPPVPPATVCHQVKAHIFTSSSPSPPFLPPPFLCWYKLASPDSHLSLLCLTMEAFCWLLAAEYYIVLATLTFQSDMVWYLCFTLSQAIVIVRFYIFISNCLIIFNYSRGGLLWRFESCCKSGFGSVSELLCIR